MIAAIPAATLLRPRQQPPIHHGQGKEVSHHPGATGVDGTDGLLLHIQAPARGKAHGSHEVRPYWYDTRYPAPMGSRPLTVGSAQKGTLPGNQDTIKIDGRLATARNELSNRLRHARDRMRSSLWEDGTMYITMIEMLGVWE
jgi:hypothetical protein